MSVIYRAFTGLAALSAASTAAIDLAAFAAAGGDLTPPRCTCPDHRNPADTTASDEAVPLLPLPEGVGGREGSTTYDRQEASLIPSEI